MLGCMQAGTTYSRTVRTREFNSTFGNFCAGCVRLLTDDGEFTKGGRLGPWSQTQNVTILSRF